MNNPSERCPEFLAVGMTYVVLTPFTTSFRDTGNPASLEAGEKVIIIGLFPATETVEFVLKEGSPTILALQSVFEENMGRKAWIPKAKEIPNPKAYEDGDTLVITAEPGKSMTSWHDGGAGQLVKNVDILRDNPCGTMSNPSTSKRTLLARQMDAVYTDQGVLDFGRCPAYGLEDGSVFVKAGERGPAPAGLITNVVYVDTSKARLVRRIDPTGEESRKKLTTPWEHDFSKTAARVYKVKGGYLLKGDMPLWENRTYSV
jgi:hypothetical protein